jgi:hypothetical protein
MHKITLITILTLLVSVLTFEKAEAKNYYLGLDEFSISINKFTGNRTPELPQIGIKDWAYRVETDFDVTILNTIFWRNNIHGEATESKFQTMGWQYEMGFSIKDAFEIFWKHHSRHTLDIENPTWVNTETNEVFKTKFPVEDSVVVRLIFYKK